ncbi:MAG: YhdP family protein [Legionellaceae bacterium]|nr:YhdP family protein [Legionellaceae bacterium]
MKFNFSKLKKISLNIIKKSYLSLVVLIVLFAIIFSLFRALTPWVKEYKTDVEKRVSVKLGQPVTIQSLETSWYWFRPVLKLNDVKVLSEDSKTLRLNKLLIGIDLWGSLWSWQIKPGILYLGDVNLVVRQKDDHWQVDGLKDHKQTMHLSQHASSSVLDWLLSQESVIVKHLAAEFYLKDGVKVSLQDFNFKAVNSHGRYKIYGDAKLDQQNPTEVSVAAVLQINPDDFKQINGKVYLSLQDFMPGQWLRFLPKMPYQVNKGLCNLDAWFDLKDGSLSSLQTIFNFKSLSLLELSSSKTHKIESFKANVAWRKLKSGWQVLADNIDLAIDGVTWPKNKLSLEYNNDISGYNVFIESLLLDSALAANISWPEKMQDILKMHPTGELHNTQLHIRENKPSYVLTRFRDLGWKGRENIPAVSKISGVLYWEPTEGRLILDGEKTTVLPHDLSPITFDIFNADLYWKELNNGFRFNLDRFVLSNNSLVVSANGALDNFRHSDSNIRLEADFSAKNARNLLKYIPSGHLKPKFEKWLKNDVRRIGHASGRMLIKGNLDDFPFENKKGQFLVTSHVSGVDIAINPSWPLNRDIDADLEFNKRSFVANVDQANLQGLAINKLNLVVNNLGFGSESLLIHGEIEAPGDQIKNYIYATPLKDRLARWKTIDIDDQFFVDLNLDIPLYPENDHVAALGEMVFSENPVIINLPSSEIKVDDVTGGLKFNEYGLTSGNLRGVLDGSAVSLQARSLLTPKVSTVIAVNGETSVEYLQKTLNLPALQLFSGHSSVSGLWTLYPDEADLDTLRLSTNLDGVAIDFPEPLKKANTDIAPLVAELEFGDKGRIDMHLNYNQILDSKLLFSTVNKAVVFNKGELQLGSTPASIPVSSGLRVAGDINTVSVEKWHSALSQLPRDESSFSLMDILSSTNLQVKNLVLAGQTYKQLTVVAHKKDKKNWALNIAQENLKAHLNYNLPSKFLSGDIDNLYLNFDLSSNNSESKWNASPDDLPNMDLKIKDFRVQNFKIGELEFKSTSTKKDWTLNSLDIKSSDYHLQAEGAWKSVVGKDRTVMRVNLQIDNLCKSLERFHITPVVHSHHGNINFEGGWKGTIYDYSIKHLMGNMSVTFKSGRISNFDKDVEEKLGLGKLLSILSLQTIPRRLKLDFSDLSQNGYSFDIFKGTFLLNKGDMSTTDSYIDGPVAYAKMTGNIDLSKHLYDVNLRITPYITASLPVVATIAGGPIAGFATWVASSIINKGMQNISGYTYKVSGPWSDPVVQQVKIYKREQ